MDIKFTELKCQRCGGELEEQNDVYVCKNCDKKWVKENFYGFKDMLEACEEANRRQRLADVANLRQLLWKETRKEYVSNKEVERICRDILKYLPQDFYAGFFLSTCSKSKTALADFLFTVDADEYYEDISLMLDYVLKALKPEWVMGVSNFIEKVKSVDVSLYHKYRTVFEDEQNQIDECVFEPAIPRDVFIAYSSKDMQKVTELVSVLEKENLTCFVAAINMRHGSGSADKYYDIIHTAIDNCQTLAFVSSDNSRSTKCDAYRELCYIKENHEDMPRVEYVIQNYCGKAAEVFFKKFFDGHEYCTDPQDVAARVSELIMNGESRREAENKAKAEEAARKAEEERARIERERKEREEREERERERKEREEQERIEREQAEKARKSSALGDFKDIGSGYVIFGSYPKSKKSFLVKIGELYDAERGYYLGSDNCLYEEYQGGYYKVEPIKWKVLSRGSEWFIVADDILDQHRFNNSTNNHYNYDNSANNYSYSEVRSWLKGDFYNKAFSAEQKSKILTKTVDNSLASTGDSSNRFVCGNTTDAVFLLSYDEYAQYLRGSSAAKKSRTDYAKARGVDGAELWLLRTPHGEILDGNCVKSIGHNKKYTYVYTNVDNNQVGIVPAIRIQP